MNVDHPQYNYISLFAGGGGLDLGFERAVRNARLVVAVERESFACAVLAARMAEGVLASAPIYTDVISFSGVRFRGLVDAIIGGSPCTNLSVAGDGVGLDGEKSGLFFQQIRIIEEVQPRWCLWENVGGAKKELPSVFEAFTRLGYTGKCVSVRASDVGAPHRRARYFLLAYRTGEGLQGSSGEGFQRSESRTWSGRVGDSMRRAHELHRRPRELPGEVEEVGGAGFAAAGSESGAAGPELADSNGRRQSAVGATHYLDRRDASRYDDDGRGSEVADAECSRPQKRIDDGRAPRETSTADTGQATERVRRPEWPPGPDEDWSGISPRFFPAVSRVRRVADGLARGLEPSLEELEREALLQAEDCWADRLRMLGNGVVPKQAEEAIRFLFNALKKHP